MAQYPSSSSASGMVAGRANSVIRGDNWPALGLTLNISLSLAEPGGRNQAVAAELEALGRSWQKPAGYNRPVEQAAAAWSVVAQLVRMAQQAL